MSRSLIFDGALTTDVEREVMLGQLRRAELVDGRGLVLRVRVHRDVPEVITTKRKLARTWCTILAEHSGSTHGAMWRALKKEVFGVVEVVNPLTGEIIEEPPSSTNFSDDEWRKFLHEIEHALAPHLNVTLPRSPAEWEAYRNGRKPNYTQRSYL